MGQRRRSFNRGAWAVQRERFHIERETPPPDFHVMPLTDVLSVVMKKWGLSVPLWLETLRQNWPEIVGPDNARHSRPGRLEKGTLTIFVSHSAWLMELKRMEKPLLEKIRSNCGKEQIRGIRFNLDPGDT